MPCPKDSYSIKSMKTKEQIQKLNKSLSVLKHQYKEIARRRKTIQRALKKCDREDQEIVDKMNNILEKLGL